MAGLRLAPIEVRDLTVAYDRHPAVHHVTCRFEPGSLTAVVGPNGAGKSTLIKSIVGLLRPAEGRVSVGDLKRRDIAYLPQQADIDRSFPITVADTVALGHWARVGIFRAIGRPLRDKVAEALSAVGLEGFEQRPIGSLSSGQFQRVLFARLLLQDAGVILLDEPFNAIDARTTQDLLDLIGRWHGEKRTVIAVLHDMDQVRQHFPDTLLLARELVANGPTPDCLTAANLLAARRMSERWQDDAAVCAPEKRRA
ncbi:zinc ABC transporter ATP-binding protein AztA [Zavarzinia aquatilis]|uniref:ABC transporter n=1 Tax=Zavarzinia aquatilis TaxID=2211142 RepID=A0A317DX33_9PROT|nr:zinc ABC transporter ATP-binding protein AztA [Zavarzinia aquatilis]PWR17503.1 ABC transporter [Zavarzinia aquatilis]